jgi:hypothetical protein
MFIASMEYPVALRVLYPSFHAFSTPHSPPFFKNPREWLGFLLAFLAVIGYNCSVFLGTEFVGRAGGASAESSGTAALGCGRSELDAIQ